MKMINNDCNGLINVGYLRKIIMNLVDQHSTLGISGKIIMKLLNQRWVFYFRKNNHEIG